MSSTFDWLLKGAAISPDCALFKSAEQNPNTTTKRLDGNRIPKKNGTTAVRTTVEDRKPCAKLKIIPDMKELKPCRDYAKSLQSPRRTKSGASRMDHLPSTPNTKDSKWDCVRVAVREAAAASAVVGCKGGDAKSLMEESDLLRRVSLGRAAMLQAHKLQAEMIEHEGEDQSTRSWKRSHDDSQSYSSSDGSMKDEECGDCDEGVKEGGQQWCYECHMILCQVCATFHKRSKRTKDHDLTVRQFLLHTQTPNDIPHPLHQLYLSIVSR